MKALRTILSTYAIALLMSCGFATTSMAGSSDFSGIYGALWAAGGGAEIDGTHTTRDDTTTVGDITAGQVGGIVPLGGYEIGFNLPLGDIFFLGVGHSWVQSGTATLARGTDNNTQKIEPDSQGTHNAQGNFHLAAKNLKSVYIMPSISVFDNTAVYAKIGRSIADLELTGDATGVPGNLSGNTWGVGTIAMSPVGIFVKTEGTFTEFDDIQIVGVGGSNSLVEGNPDVVTGSVAIGFKF
mgnify:CR=1 FL=1|jgi:hypothetical protein|tara:strand:- start:1565 stop:2284 length:720 start_codon:yes stop_codon:yes gene_type:complete